MNKWNIAIVALGIMCTAPLIASAHQPRIVENGAPVVVSDPEISKAYYGKLEGEPQVFTIDALEPFKFYMGILVPDVDGAKKDVSVALVDTANPKVPVAVLDGVGGAWKEYFEEFGRDNYFKGPEFTSMLPPGSYQVLVWSSNNDSAYTLAIGEKESFGVREIALSYVSMPKIKTDFFDKPAYSAYLTPVLGGPLVLVALAIVGGIWLYRRRATYR